MTQEKTLLELPSQLDFDWQESATQGPSIAPPAAQNPVEEVDTFVLVSQIAQEAVMDATQGPPSTLTTRTADASSA